MTEPLRAARAIHKTEPVSQGAGSVDDEPAGSDDDVAWDDFISWVEWVIETYRLMNIPPCWPEHPGAVQELAALFFFRRSAERQVATWANGLEMWHSSLAAASERITRLITSCTQNHHEPVSSFGITETKYARTGILDIKAAS
jgi:hypothetical protein